MSIRAYKIIKKELEDNPTFNVWHDTKVFDYLQDNNLLDKINIELSRKNYVDLLLLDIDEDIKKILKRDFKSLGDYDYVVYECF